MVRRGGGLDNRNSCRCIFNSGPAFITSNQEFTTIGIFCMHFEQALHLENGLGTIGGHKEMSSIFADQ